MICSRESACSAYDLVSEVLKRVCLIDVNLGKLAAWCKDDATAPSGIMALQEQINAERGTDCECLIWRSDLPPESNGIMVVGSPLGSAEFIRQHGAKVAEEEVQLLKVLFQSSPPIKVSMKTSRWSFLVWWASK